MDSTDPPHSDVDASLQPKRKRRRLLHHHPPPPSPSPWSTHKHQQIYSSKLFQAIRYVRRNSLVRARHIRQTADRVLAASAKGTTRWSRAILSTPHRLSLPTTTSTRHVKVKVRVRVRVRGKITNNRFQRKLDTTTSIRTRSRKRNKHTLGVDNKLRLLRRLIPGCKKVPFPNLLEEATDYISALEMQVRAMAALTEILSGSHRIGSAPLP